MENLHTGIIPIGLLVFGILVKILMEFYLPESSQKKHLKKNTIHFTMAIVFLLMSGNIVYLAMTNSWTQDFYVNILFQVFLASLFLAFLVVVNALIVLSASFTDRFNGSMADSR